MSMENCNFTNNIAKYGGTLYQSQKQTYTPSKSNTFTNNTATVYGNNSASYPVKVSNYPTKANLAKTKATFTIVAQSGIPLDE